MSRRIDIELTSALPDDSWTWRAAGAKQPKGTLDGSILSPGAAVGDVIKVEVEQEMDGITIRSVVGGRQKQERDDVLEMLPTEREFKPVIETKAKRDRGERRRDDRGPRRGRDDRGRGRRDRADKGDREGRGDRGRGDRGGRGKRGGPSFTPPPEIPQRPKPKRLKPGKKNRNAVLAEIPEEQRGIAEVALQGMGAVRQRLREENEKAAIEGRSPMPEATVLKMAEDLLPQLRVAEWRDRAEAAQRQMEHLDLRDLRSVVAAAGDPAVARDETTAALAAELTDALATKQEQELLLWFGDVDAALAVGRVIRALRLSSQPPKAGVPFPTDIAQRLVDSTNASLAPMDSADRWIAMLEAAAFSPIRTSVAPVRKPDVVSDELLATVKRLAPALPQVALLFEVEVDPKAPMPKPLRPGPRNRKGGKDAKEGDRGGRNRGGRKQSAEGGDARSKGKTGGDSGKQGRRGATPPADASSPAPTTDSKQADAASTTEDAAAAPREAASDAPAAAEGQPETPAPDSTDDSAEQVRAASATDDPAAPPEPEAPALDSTDDSAVDPVAVIDESAGDVDAASEPTVDDSTSADPVTDESADAPAAVDSIDEPAADEDGNDVSSGDADAVADPDSATA